LPRVSLTVTVVLPGATGVTVSVVPLGEPLATTVQIVLSNPEAEKVLV